MTLEEKLDTRIFKLDYPLDDKLTFRKERGDEIYLTPKEVAHISTLTESTLQVWRKRKKGPLFKKLGNRIAYPLKTLEDFIKMSRIDFTPSFKEKIKK